MLFVVFYVCVVPVFVWVAVSALRGGAAYMALLDHGFLLLRHVWCRASTGELFVARRRRLATGAAQLRSDTVSATSEADASARRAKPRANKMAKTGRNAVVSALFSLHGGALNCRRCSLRECCLLEGEPASGPKRLATTRHWVPHGLRRHLADQKPRHRAQGAQNTGKQHDPAKGPLCSATRRLRCGEEGVIGRGPPDLG